MGEIRRANHHLLRFIPLVQHAVPNYAMASLYPVLMAGKLGSGAMLLLQREHVLDWDKVRQQTCGCVRVPRV